MQKLIILRGLPFSGKTTWAEKFNEKQGRRFVIFNTDEIIAAIKQQFPMMTRTELRDAADIKLVQTIAAGYSIIVDDVNVINSHLARVIECVKQANERTGMSVYVEIKQFSTPIGVCIDRAIKSGLNEEAVHTTLDRYYRYCLRKKIIYSNEENSKTDL